MGYDSVLNPRVLREIYLMPFMLAQKYAQPWSIMTAYVEHLSRDDWSRQRPVTIVSMVSMLPKMPISYVISSERSGSSTEWS
jgi:hypothetical protein